MAFNLSNFDPTGSGSKGGTAAPKHAVYGTSDTFATVEGANYFDDVADLLKSGDMLDVYSSAAADGGFRRYQVAVASSVVTLTRRLFPNTAVLPFVIPQTELLAGTPIYMVSPVSGRVSRLRTVVQADVTTGDAIIVSVDGTSVDGLSITIANGATAGTTQSGTPTVAHASAVVAAGEYVAIVPGAAFATAGAVNGVLEIELTT